MKISKAVILAGGNGTRMNPISMYLPKSYLPIYDEPLLIKQIRWLINAKVEMVILAINIKYYEILNSLIQLTGIHNLIDIQYVVENQPKGIGYSLHNLREKLGSDRFWFILGDEYFREPSFFDNYKSFYEDNTIILTAVKYKSKKLISQGCNFKLENNSITNLIEKPNINKIVSEWCWGGTAIFNDKLFDVLSHLISTSETYTNGLLIDTLNYLINQGEKILFYEEKTENVNLTDLSDYYRAFNYERLKERK